MPGPSLSITLPSWLLAVLFNLHPSRFAIWISLTSVASTNQYTVKYCIHFAKHWNLDSLPITVTFNAHNCSLLNSYKADLITSKVCCIDLDQWTMITKCHQTRVKRKGHWEQPSFQLTLYCWELLIKYMQLLMSSPGTWFPFKVVLFSALYPFTIWTQKNLINSGSDSLQHI